MITVLLADDDVLVRQGLRVLLESADDLLVVAEAADGAEAVELAASTKPDVVVMDVRMSGEDGIEATRRDRVVAVSATLACSCSRRSISTRSCTTLSRPAQMGSCSSAPHPKSSWTASAPSPRGRR